jgi:hypothetical protein
MVLLSALAAILLVVGAAQAQAPPAGSTCEGKLEEQSIMLQAVSAGRIRAEAESAVEIARLRQQVRELAKKLDDVARTGKGN